MPCVEEAVQILLNCKTILTNTSIVLILDNTQVIKIPSINQEFDFKIK